MDLCFLTVDFYLSEDKYFENISNKKMKLKRYDLYYIVYIYIKSIFKNNKI